MNQQQIDALNSIKASLNDIATKIETIVKPERTITLRFSDKDQPCTSKHSLELFPNDDIIVVNMDSNYAIYSLVTHGEPYFDASRKEETLGAVYFVLHHLGNIHVDPDTKNKLVNIMLTYVKNNFPELIEFLKGNSLKIPCPKTIDQIKLMTKVHWSKGADIIFKKMYSLADPNADTDNEEVAKAVHIMMRNGISYKFLDFINH